MVRNMETRERIARCRGCGDRIKTSSDNPICPECHYGRKITSRGTNNSLVKALNGADVC